MNNQQPLVSINCLVYNHEPYLRQCLDGFVMQKTNFPFEAIVHDDASTDCSANIIREYAEKYPDIIKPIFEIENQYSKRDGSLWRIMNDACKGKYIALCEGDDYWIDDCKLQKQVDFMELNPEYSLCCSNYKIYSQKKQCFIPNKKIYSTDFDLDKNTNLKSWTTKTLTVFYRKSCLDIKKINIFPLNRDVHMFYAILMNGKGRYFSDTMGVYRVHSGGVHSSGSNLEHSKLMYQFRKDLLLLDPENKTVLTHEIKRSQLNYFTTSVSHEINGDSSWMKYYVKCFLNTLSVKRIIYFFCYLVVYSPLYIFKKILRKH